LRILREVDLVACEDTRTTRKLLSAQNIRTTVASYHEQGGKGRGAGIVRRILSGENVALVSEAGTPGVSDPGYELVRRCLDEGIEVQAIPGPSAILAALSASGLSVDRFVFEGFLPRRRAERVRRLEDLREETRTLVFFESPRRIASTLADMAEILRDRQAVVARELTKTFEEFRRGTLMDLVAWAAAQEVRGEITLLVAGRERRVPAEAGLASRIRFLRDLCELADRDLVRLIHEETGIPRKSVYRAMLAQNVRASAPSDEGRVGGPRDSAVPLSRLHSRARRSREKG
jgi:16S rRNA (cytidine1402-2'-O)-methyltransferase